MFTGNGADQVEYAKLSWLGAEQLPKDAALAPACLMATTTTCIGSAGLDEGMIPFYAHDNHILAHHFFLSSMPFARRANVAIGTSPSTVSRCLPATRLYTLMAPTE